MQLTTREPRQEKRPAVSLGRIPIHAVDIQEMAQAVVDYCRSAERAKATRPIYSTSLNGQVISLCAQDRELRESILSADSVNAERGELASLREVVGGVPTQAQLFAEPLEVGNSVGQSPGHADLVLLAP